MTITEALPRMFNYETIRLMHLHGEERFPMQERSHHDAADHDPERGWRTGARIFRCTACADEIVVMPPAADIPDTETA